MDNNYFKLNNECLKCKIKKYLLNHPQMSKDNLQDYLFDVLKVFASLEKGTCSLQIDEIIKEKYPTLFVDKDYSEIKKYFNDLLLSQYAKLQEIVNVKEDQLLQAMKLTMVANYIDFSAFNTIDEDLLSKLLNEADKQSINLKTYEKFKDDLAEAKNLLLITDNCGEIVLDKLMLEKIKECYPNLDITCMVKGGEIGNDASLVDAKQIEMEEICEVTTNGSKLPGTMLLNLPLEKQRLIQDFDVIISKGQANAETLLNCGLNIYYMLLCKCEYYGSLFHCNKFEVVFHRELDGLK